MLSIFGTILGLIPGALNTVSGITAAITNERVHLENAKTDQERIASQERITSLQAKRDVLIAESANSNLNAVIRGWIGSSVALLLFKLLVWDKALGTWTGGHTDPLDEHLWGVVTASIGFYFLYEGAVNTARILKS